MAGDRAALAQLYSTDPPANLIVGKTNGTLDSELQYWSSLRPSGLADLEAKVLSIETANGATRLALRLQGHTAKGEAIVASMLQIWAKQAGGWRIVASQRSDVVLDAGRRLPEPAKPNPQLYPAPGEASAELQSARAKAAREHKRILVIFGANWCYDCHVLDATFRSPQFASLVNSNYIVIHINTGDDGKENNDLAARFGVSLEHGIPSLAVLDATAKVIVAQQNGEFESTTRIGPEDVRVFLEKWKPPRS